MSNKLIRKSLAFLLVAVMAFAVFGCAPKTPPEETGKPTETSAPPTTEAPPKEVLPDVPADRYDALATPRTGSNATVPLVVSTGTLDGKFNPFF